MDFLRAEQVTRNGNFQYCVQSCSVATATEIMKEPIIMGDARRPAAFEVITKPIDHSLNKAFLWMAATDPALNPTIQSDGTTTVSDTVLYNVIWGIWDTLYPQQTP